MCLTFLKISLSSDVSAPFGLVPGVRSPIRISSIFFVTSFLVVCVAGAVVAGDASVIGAESHVPSPSAANSPAERRSIYIPAYWSQDVVVFMV